MGELELVSWATVASTTLSAVDLPSLCLEFQEGWMGFSDGFGTPLHTQEVGRTLGEKAGSAHYLCQLAQCSLSRWGRTGLKRLSNLPKDPNPPEH